LHQFQDNEKTIPTVLTTSRKLSTGVDARNIRNIVLLRPINSMIEFKQIIGRGTRIFDGKSYFTVYDFVDASRLFADPEWDGEPIEPEPKAEVRQRAAAEEREQDNLGPDDEAVKKKTLKIKLADGKEREINYSSFTLFMNAAGEIISAEEFVRSLFGELPKLFHSEEELRKIWSSPMTRKALLDKLTEAGYGRAELAEMQKLINAEKPVSREERALQARSKIAALINRQQQEFIEFVLAKYAESGVEVLGMDKLSPLLELKYRSIQDALQRLGSTGAVQSSFIEFQGYLYEKAA
jgi:type I restriction enzyme R subunit